MPHALGKVLSQRLHKIARPVVDDDEQDAYRPRRISDLGLVGGNALLLGGLGAAGASIGGGGADWLMGNDPQFGRRAAIGGAAGATMGAGVGTLMAVLRAAREGRV